MFSKVFQFPMFSSFNMFVFFHFSLFLVFLFLFLCQRPHLSSSPRLWTPRGFSEACWILGSFQGITLSGSTKQILRLWGDVSWPRCFTVSGFHRTHRRLSVLRLHSVGIVSFVRVAQACAPCPMALPRTHAKVPAVITFATVLSKEAVETVKKAPNFQENSFLREYRFFLKRVKREYRRLI